MSGFSKVHVTEGGTDYHWGYKAIPGKPQNSSDESLIKVVWECVCVSVCV